MRTSLLLSLFCLCVAATGHAQDPAPAPASAADPVAEADALVKQRGLKNYQRAVELYGAALEKKPGDEDLMFKLATALNSVMRTKTYGNIITIEGKTIETDKNKKLWADHGKRSLDLLEKLKAKRKGDIEFQLQYAEAFMYHSTSFGLIKAVTSGTATTYKENANTLIKLNEKADGGVGHIYLGGFYLVAPWPLSDDDESLSHYEKAVKLAPQSVRNQYYRGLRAYVDEDWATAKTHWTRAKDQKCGLKSELDFCWRLKKEAEKGLAAVANK